MNPSNASTNAPERSPSPVAKRLPLARRRLLAVGAAAVLVAVAAGGLWFYQAHNTVAVPALPDIDHPEIREAMEKARNGVLEQPGSAEAWGEYGMVLMSHQFYPAADLAFAQAAEIDPADARWPYARGLIALRSNPEAAPAHLRAAIAARTHPELQTLARLSLAEWQLERRDLDAASELFEQVRRQDEANARAAFGLGLIAAERGDARAAAFFELARSSPFYRKQAAAQLAIVARNRKDPGAAALEQTVAGLPDDPQWPDPFVQQVVLRRVHTSTQRGDAATLERQGMFGAAAEAYLDQARAHPTARAYMGAGLNFARVSEFERAVPLLREAIRLDADDPAAHFTLASVLSARAEREARTGAGPKEEAKQWYREAVEQAKRATELKPDHAQAYLLWGQALRALGDAKAAVQPLRQGVAARPTDLDLQIALGETLVELGYTDEARTTLEDARSLDAQDPRASALLRKLPAAPPK